MAVIELNLTVSPEEWVAPWSAMLDEKLSASFDAMWFSRFPIGPTSAEVDDVIPFEDAWTSCFRGRKVVTLCPYIVGELDGGVDAWRAAGRPIDGIPLVTPADMVGTVIDVRQRAEFETGHLPGAVNLELGNLATSAVLEGPVTVMCGHGERAMTAASILAGRGHRDVSVLDGGPDTWAAWTGHPLAVDR
jgi:rhodanese-related sulfurtransferase